MTSTETPDAIHTHAQEQMSSPYLFLDSDEIQRFITPEMHEWLQNATIVHIAPPWLPVPHELRNYGGTENVLEANIAGLAALGVKHQVIIGQPGNALLQDRYGKDITIVVPEDVDYSKNLLALKRTEPERAEEIERKYVHEAYRWISENRVKLGLTVVHDHTDWGRVFGPALNPSIPVIRTEHNPLRVCAISPLAERMLTRLEERTSRRSTRNIGSAAISEYLKTERRDLNWLNGAFYNGIDLAKLAYRDKNADPILANERYLVYLGRVTEDKGVHHAIRIANGLGMKLYIAGAVEETEEAQRYFEDQIQPHLHTRGKIIHFDKGVGPMQKMKLLRDAMCLLMPGEWPEPFGMVAIEALASGTPVVAFRRGGIPEIINTDEKIGFAVDNINEAVAAVQAICNGDFSSQACRERVERHFSSIAMSARYVKAYMEQEKSQQVTL